MKYKSFAKNFFSNLFNLNEKLIWNDQHYWSSPGPSGPDPDPDLNPEPDPKPDLKLDPEPSP